jgi:hypothetical protein
MLYVWRLSMLISCSDLEVCLWSYVYIMRARLFFSYRGGVGEQRLSEADQMEIWVRLKHWCGRRAHAGAKESRHAIYMLHLRGCLIACLRTWPSGVVWGVVLEWGVVPSCAAYLQKASSLAKTAFLMEQLFKVCVNGLVPNKKCLVALEYLADQGSLSVSVFYRSCIHGARIPKVANVFCRMSMYI